MKTGILAAYGRAAAVLWQRPALLGCACICEVPLFLAILAALTQLAAAWADLTAVERWQSLEGLAAVLLVAAGLLTFAEAWLLDQSDRLLRATDSAAGERRRSLGRLVARVLVQPAGLWLGRQLLDLAGLLFAAALLSGASLDVLGEVFGGRGLAATRSAWAARGTYWVIGMSTLVVLSYGARELLRLAAVFYRAALVTEDRAALRAVSSAIRFAVMSGWGLLGRTLLRGLLYLTVGLPALWLWASSRHLATMARPAGAAAVLPPLLAAGLATAAVTLWVLLRAWLRLGDLVYYRAWGGADCDTALATRVVRQRRNRVAGRAQPGELVVASEPASPAGIWRPRTPAERTSRRAHGVTTRGDTESHSSWI